MTTTAQANSRLVRWERVAETIRAAGIPSLLDPVKVHALPRGQVLTDDTGTYYGITIRHRAGVVEVRDNWARVGRYTVWGEDRDGIARYNALASNPQEVVDRIRDAL